MSQQNVKRNMYIVKMRKDGHSFNQIALAMEIKKQTAWSIYNRDKEKYSNTLDQEDNFAL